MIDVHSEHYHVAREYMIRLEPRDLTDSDMLKRLADAAHVDPDTFAEAFASAAAFPQT
jgi:6-phosphofructokinase 1